MGNELNTVEAKEVSAQSNNPAHLLQIAVEKGAEVDQLSKLMDLQDRWEAKQAQRSFFNALASFQEKCPRITKRKKGHNYKYAPLGDIIEQIRPALKECGLTYRFEQSEENSLVKISCVITHIDGHSEKTSMSGEDDTSGSKNSIQAKGSTVTYLQRYTLIGALGIATADEDIDARLPQKPVQIITEEQAVTIQAALESKDYPIEQFLKVGKLERIDDLPASKFKSVMKHIETWSAE